MISKYGVGLNNIDIEVRKELGVEIAFTPGATIKCCRVCIATYIECIEEN